MAMLAEPRRRQKWSADPRNSAWTKDESKFGQKMLEKMGWSKGKGLGKEEQGATEHIKVKVKNNTLGLGTNVNHEDNWIAHQDDFNQILADLNNCHGQSECVAEEKKSFSLEEKSKTSRKRVHYMKFTKGKDLSSRSETDLACIFGKRTKKSKDQEESNGQDSQGEKELEEEENETPCSEVEVTVNTVTSTLTMQEYFAQRMAQLKNEREEKRNPTTTPSTSEDSLDAIDTKHEILKKKKKKKSKNKDKDVGKEETEDCIGSPDGEEHEEKEHEQSSRSTGGKKKKRRSMDKEETGGVTTSSYEEHLDTGAGDGKEAQHYTDRKLKKHKKPSKESDVEDEHTVVQEEAADLDRPEKGRKRKKEAEAPEASEEKKAKKDKKKKRKHELNGN
ncbi:PIN2/TERF1-interacting telomerase inhibitor 1 [Scleropages formosus]|uniref:PIN2 (TERF1) interacting telomerase inhibitor 1 n=1 Tax=Scleropages formosus TaxID=113540 RepID=A0A8C9V1C1_SCLFO|nr:PIN2/TERF1-interacting telomerase inhibitor 1 [Scleropages formosus]